VRDTIFSAGGGVIGGYDSCSYSSPGEGTFRGGEETNPFAGEKGKLHTEKEIRLEVILYSHLKNGIIRALLKVHPYEEPAFDIYPLENDLLSAGLGCYGELSVPVEENRFLEILMNEFSAQGIRHSGFTGKMISKVALCGGAGGPLLNDAIASGADAFVSADIRYHSFFEAEGRLLLADIGHFESEKFSVEILYDLIIKKFPNFALRFSGTNTNPINYLHDGEK
jgi:hypothetical protein